MFLFHVLSREDVWCWFKVLFAGPLLRKSRSVKLCTGPQLKPSPQNLPNQCDRRLVIDVRCIAECIVDRFSHTM